MPTVAIISKPQKKELVRTIPELVQWLQERKFEVIADAETISYFPQGKPIAREAMASYRPKFAIVLGGDGTLLAATRVLSHAGIPILAVNLGTLGFLTEVALEDLYQNLQSVLDGSCTVDVRSMLHCQLIRRGQLLSEHHVLNDIVVAQGAIARMTEYVVEIDGMFVSNYKADGLIVATPTGSTAYSLAAGGPIVVPSVKAFVMTPVSPHALTNRPLVVQDSSEIRISTALRHQEAYLTVDGQLGFPLEDGDQILCRRSGHEVKLLRVPKRERFFEVLRDKLHWGER